MEPYLARRGDKDPGWRWLFGLLPARSQSHPPHRPRHSRRGCHLLSVRPCTSGHPSIPGPRQFPHTCSCRHGITAGKDDNLSRPSVIFLCASCFKTFRWSNPGERRRRTTWARPRIDYGTAGGKCRNHTGTVIGRLYLSFCPCRPSHTTVLHCPTDEQDASDMTGCMLGQSAAASPRIS